MKSTKGLHIEYIYISYQGWCTAHIYIYILYISATEGGAHHTFLSS